MKNKSLLCAIVFSFSVFCIPLYAQSWQTGSNSIGIALLYTYPSSTFVGIGTSNPLDKLHVQGGNIRIGYINPLLNRGALLKFGSGDAVRLGVWEGSNALSFRASRFNFVNGNVGVGVTEPQYKLDVNGKLFLHTVDHGDRWERCYLNWEKHILMMGVPQGTYAHTIVQIMPGGSSEGQLYSCLSLFHAYSESDRVEKVHFTTHEHSWINTSGNFGLGTNTPQYKLDVRGTIRANEVLVNTASGADFVFDESYNLRPLSEVKEYIQTNLHLPEIPSAAEMQENGVNMNELQMQLLQKVEELTLYIIQQEQRILELESQLTK